MPIKGSEEASKWHYVEMELMSAGGGGAGGRAPNLCPKSFANSTKYRALTKRMAQVALILLNIRLNLSE
jgi:hypothetical protein